MSVFQPFTGDTLEELKKDRIKSPDFLLCNNCGWNSHTNEHYLYCSHIRISCHANRGIWSIGNNYILKERPLHEHGEGDYESMAIDTAISQYLEKNSTVPIAKDSKYWSDSISCFQLMQKVSGETLESAINDGRFCTEEELEPLAEEIVQYLLQIRKFTSNKAEGPNGERVIDDLFSSRSVVEYFDDVEEWWARTEPRIKPEFSKEWKEDFKKRYPIKWGDTFVLSHGDLSPSNIFIKDGHVSAIIDWEHGGFKPEWFEAWALRLVDTDTRWPMVLSRAFNYIIPMPEREIYAFQTDWRRSWVDYGGRVRTKEVERFDKYVWYNCPNYRKYLEDKNTRLDDYEEQRLKAGGKPVPRPLFQRPQDRLKPRIMVRTRRIQRPGELSTFVSTTESSTRIGQ